MRSSIILLLLASYVYAVHYVQLTDTQGCPISAGEVDEIDQLFLVSDGIHCKGAHFNLTSNEVTMEWEDEKPKVGVVMSPKETVTFGPGINQDSDSVVVCLQKDLTDSDAFTVENISIRDCIFMQKDGIQVLACIGFEHVSEMFGWIVWHGREEALPCSNINEHSYTFYPQGADIGYDWHIPHNALVSGYNLDVITYSELDGKIVVTLWTFAKNHEIYDPDIVYTRVVQSLVFEPRVGTVALFDGSPFLFAAVDVVTAGKVTPAVMYFNAADGASDIKTIRLSAVDGAVAGIALWSNYLYVLQQDAGYVVRVDLNDKLVPKIDGYAELTYPRFSCALDMFLVKNHLIALRREWPGMSFDVIDPYADFCMHICNANTTCSKGECVCKNGFVWDGRYSDCVSEKEKFYEDLSLVKCDECSSKSGTIWTLAIFFVLAFIGDIGLAYWYILKPQAGYNAIN